MNDLKYIGFDFERSTSIGIAEVKSVFNMPFLAMFGGNIEQSQPVFRNDGEILNSWWGNSFGLEENSETERFLRSMVLSTSTPEKLEKVIMRDLSFLSPFFEIRVAVTIPMVNRVNIDVFLSDKKTGETTEINYLWNSLLDDINSESDSSSINQGLNYVLNFNI